MSTRLLRRDITGFLFASVAVGSTLASQRTLARDGPVPGAWGRAPAEARLGIVPRDLRYPVGHVLRYGAVGDWDGASGTDNTAAFRSALDVCHETGHTMYVPAGRYRISAPLQKGQSFACPNIRGEGYSRTRIAYPDLGGAPALYIQGGSGRLCGAVIEGIGFDGARRTCGIEVDGQDGLTIRDCAFGENAVGLRLHNATAGAFTEYVVAEGCHFDGACARALEFRVSGGNNSFNGSGLRHCTIVVDERHDCPVHIGKGALPYNAPLSMQVWTYGRRKTLVRNDTARPVLVHGTITLEAFGHFESRAHVPTLAQGAPMYLVGGLMSTGPINLGSAVLGSRAALLGPESGRANGQALIRRFPWSVRVPLGERESRTVYLGDDSGQLVYVELSAPGYDYRLLLATAHHGRGGRGFVRTLETLNDFDDAGYGAPSFAMDAGGMLIIANPAFRRAAVTAFIDVVPFGLSRTAYLESAVEHVLS